MSWCGRRWTKSRPRRHAIPMPTAAPPPTSASGRRPIARTRHSPSSGFTRATSALRTRGARRGAKRGEGSEKAREDEKRRHVKDAAILINASEWDEDKKQVSLSSEAVRVLTGTPINKDQEIKLSGTKVLELLQETASTTTMPPPPPSDGAEDANEDSSIGFSDENNDGEGGDEIAALAAGAMENAAAALQRRTPTTPSRSMRRTPGRSS